MIAILFVLAGVFFPQVEDELIRIRPTIRFTAGDAIS